ncbi:MAG: hypothetical protein ACMV0F_01110, partial [Trichlorobacter sp.]
YSMHPQKGIAGQTDQPPTLNTEVPVLHHTVQSPYSIYYAYYYHCSTDSHDHCRVTPDLGPTGISSGMY